MKIFNLAFMSSILFLGACGLHTGVSGPGATATGNNFSNQMAQTGVAGCSMVEAREESNPALRTAFQGKISKNMWQAQNCLLKKDVISFGGDIVGRGTEFTFNQTSMACTGNVFDQPLSSLIPAPTDKLIASGISEAVDFSSSQRALTWVTEDANKKARCFVIAVDFQPPNILKIAAPVEATDYKGTELTLSEFMRKQKFQSFDKL